MTVPRSTATLSADGLYRYDLTRAWGPEDEEPTTVVWVMLNPSTANVEEDDPTIRRVVGYSKAWGFTQAAVVNLFAFRTKDPDVLRRTASAAAAVPAAVIGDGNDEAIARWVTSSQMTVVGWGANVDSLLGGRTRVRQVEKIIREAGAVPLALKETKTGQPCHPLYLPKTLIPSAWRGLQ